MSTTKSIFKNSQRKRRSSTSDDADYPTTPIEYENGDMNNCKVVGNTSFVSRVRIASTTQNEHLLTPLMEACRKGNVEQVKEILTSSNEDINHSDIHGYSALYHAVFSKNVELVEYLLENKANYRQQACHGLTIFHYCIQHGDYPCMECLCKYAKADILPPASPTQRYSLDISDTDGITPLMLACKLGYDSFVKLLIQYKANPELRSFRGDNAMTFALMNNHAACVSELTTSGIFLDARSKYHHHGALFTAAQLNEIDIVRCLVQIPCYLSQFITEMVFAPSRSEEVYIEVMLREVIANRPTETIEDLARVCVKQGCACMSMLFDVCNGRKLDAAVSLAGVAEAAKWCVKMSKVLRNSILLPEFISYWIWIEEMVEHQYQHYQQEQCEYQYKHEQHQHEQHQHEQHQHEQHQHEYQQHQSKHEQQHTQSTYNSSSERKRENTFEAEAHEEVIQEQDEKKMFIRPSSSSRLLLSLLEIYAIGHYNFSHMENEDKEQYLHRLQSLTCLHERLIHFFTKYKDFLLCLVHSDPTVYDMLHFFKHSFTLFLANH